MSSDSPSSAQRPVIPWPTFARSSSSGSAAISEVNSPRNEIGTRSSAVDDEDATVVVIDQRAELGGDLVADLAHVVQPVQLPAQALQQLQVRDRAHVAGGHRRIGALGPVLLVEDDAVLAVRLRGHHRGLGARAQLAWVHGVLGTECEPDRDGDATDRRELELPEPLDETLCDTRRVGGVARAHDHAELLAAEPADDVLGPNRGAQRVREQPQQLVADAVPVHVVHALEVVDVEHQHRHRAVRPARLLERVEQPLVEGAVVEQARERVGARLVLEPRADLRVVERERGGISEALRQLELVVAERRVVTGAVDVQNALDLRPRDQRDADHRLRIDRRPRDEAHARVEMSLVHERGLAVARRPARDPLVEADGRAHDLVRPLVAGEHRHEQPLRLVRLPDRQRVVRDQVGERVGDAHEQRVEAQLREHLVEDVGQPPVRLDQLERGRTGDGVLRQQPEVG